MDPQAQVPRRDPMVFVDDLDSPALSAEDYRHLSRVRRLGPDQAITASDGAGRWRATKLGKDRLLESVGPIAHSELAQWPITVAFTPVKGDRPELTIQHLTELGVDQILVLKTERSVVKWDESRAARQRIKWETIIRGACAQSKRARFPALEAILTLEDAIARNPELVLADPTGHPLAATHRSVAIGPEGGWSADELELGAAMVSLPSGNILRAETAALAAATLCAGFRGGHL